MENVRGLAFKEAKKVLIDALNLLPGNYAVLDPMILDAAEFGAATRRPRLFVLGYDPARCDGITEEDIRADQVPPATVKAAIGDLISAARVDDLDGFDRWVIKHPGPPSHYAAKLRAPDKTFTGHLRTAHSPAVIARFRRVEPGAIDAVGRHPRLSWGSQCPTLRAGTGNDLGSYQSVRPIHPNEPRVITVREAARLQGFPDKFVFHPTIWHSFRMIGNSVPPNVSRAIFALLAKRVGAVPNLVAAE
jgi:DNA (cytosine-5)-methyltransferase 1